MIVLETGGRDIGVVKVPLTKGSLEGESAKKDLHTEWFNGGEDEEEEASPLDHQRHTS